MSSKRKFDQEIQEKFSPKAQMIKNYPRILVKEERECVLKYEELGVTVESRHILISAFTILPCIPLVPNLDLWILNRPYTSWYVEHAS